MKIFSLQSKILLVVLSVIFGFIVNWLITGFTYKNHEGLNTPHAIIDVYGGSFSSGWPFTYQFNQNVNPSDGMYSHMEYIYNMIFWIIVVLIILFTVRHFRKKKQI